MLDLVKSMITHHEGIRLFPYKCTAGKLTIGVFNPKSCYSRAVYSIQKGIGAMELFDGEEIRDIPGFEGMYAASSYGRIWSYPSRSNINLHGKWLSPGLRGKYKNYESVVLRKVGNTSLQVHRLVAMTWLPNPDKLPCVNHLDGDTRNNRVTNLEWCTYAQNSRHSWDMGLSRHTEKSRESARRLARSLGLDKRILTMADAESIRINHNSRFDTKPLAEKYGVGMHVIRRIVNGESYAE